MDPLIDLLDRLRRAATLEEQMACGEAVIRQIAPVVQMTIQRTAPPLAVEDLLQDALVAIAKGLPKCRAEDRRALLSWCVTIAQRTVANHFRSATKLKTVSLDSLETTGLAQEGLVDAKAGPAEVAALRDLLAVLERLGGECHTLLRLYYIEEWTHRQIGEAVKLSEDAVRMQINRCKAKIREMLS